MDINDAIMILESHNKWRKGANIPPVSDIELTNAIDTVLLFFKRRGDFENEC